jgi:cytochrome P450 PksS
LHPEQLALLRGDPALTPTAVEELLRYTSPVSLATERFARESLSIGGMPVARGDQVLVVLASANRDARQFRDPDRLDVKREPNRHLAFGQGIHYCLGAPLARLEGQIAIDTLLRRMPALRLRASPDSHRHLPATSAFRDRPRGVENDGRNPKLGPRSFV